VRRVRYAFIVIIVAFLGGFPAYLVLGQGGGSQEVTITVTAQPVFGVPAGGGGGAAECPAGEVSTAGRITGAGSVTRAFVIKSFDKRFSLFLDEGIIALTPYGKCPRCIGIHEMTQPPSPPEGTRLIGTMYDVVPDGVTFTPPATLRYSYDLNDIPEGIAEESLLIVCYNEASGEWTELDSVVDTESNTVTAKISWFNDLAVLGYEAVPAPAAFEISSLSISPTEVDIGEAVDITVLVTNTGGQSGDYQVILKINGIVEADRDVAPDADASEKVGFNTSKDTAGTYLVDVNGLTGSFEVKQPVSLVEPTPIKPTNWWLIGGISAAVVIAGSIIYLFFIRRQKVATKLSEN